MINYKLQILLILSMLWAANSIPGKKRYKAIQKLHRTGEAIAIDYLIRIYEREHQKLYNEEIVDGEYLEWPDLDNKNLSDYCKKYLQQTVPNRNFDGAIGIKIWKTLHYEKESTRITSDVVLLQCKVTNKSHINSYYLTRSHDANCVYALKSGGSWKSLIFNIINKQCNFDKPLANNLIKGKRMEMVGKKHQFTGQHIAKDIYLQELELEHQELLKKQGHDVNYVEWLYVKKHHNLDAYCSQYMRTCVPRRNREGVKGYWKIQKLRYQKLKTTEDIQVTMVTCHANVSTNLQYNLTRALETQCVYALLRLGSVNSPFMIIFKHCNFEELNDQQTIPQNDNVHYNVITLKTEVKEETLNTVKIL